MTKEQVILLRETYLKNNGAGQTTAKAMIIGLDNGRHYNTAADIIIWDDTNEFVHCLSINQEAYSQANQPYNVYTSQYDCIQFIEALMDRASIRAVLDSELMSCVDDTKKQNIDLWIKNVKIHGINFNRGNIPFFTSEPNVIPYAPQAETNEMYEPKYVEMVGAIGSTSDVVTDNTDDGITDTVQDDTADSTTPTDNTVDESQMNL